MRTLARLFGCISLWGMLLVAAASAQSTFETPGGSRVDGKVTMCLDAQGKAVAANQSGACPGGATAVTIADGADVAEGAVADAASTVGGTGTVSAKLRRITTQLDAIQTLVAGSAVAPVSTSALAANLVVKAGAGSLYSFEVSADSTLSAAPWWIMIYNATSAPVDGAVTPLKCYAMPTAATSYSGAFPTPVPFSTGITIGVSTTGCFTKTASTHAFISGDAQ